MQCLAISITILVFIVPKRDPRSGRSAEPGFEFVYVNQDGSARELSPAEQAYLSQDYAGADSGRPYVKGSYESQDGWGSLSGFLERRKVPTHIKVSPVHPDFDALAKDLGFDALESHRVAGDIIETQADGSVSCTPNPEISRAERFELMRDWHLAHQRERERLAIVHHPNEETKT